MNASEKTTTRLRAMRASVTNMNKARPPLPEAAIRVLVDADRVRLQLEEGKPNVEKCASTFTEFRVWHGKLQALGLVSAEGMAITDAGRKELDELGRRAK